MSYVVSGIEIGLTAALKVGLGVGCFLLYRAFRLRVLPWIASYSMMSFLTAQLMHVYAHRIRSEQSGEVDPHSTLASVAMLSSIMEDAALILIALLVFAEMAQLAMRAEHSSAAPGVRFLTRTHAYARQLGITLVLLALALPFPLIIYFYTR